MPFTVGIPFYNAEDCLANAIRAVFAQTCPDWELILLDDGSTDRSLEIARAVRDPRVRVISDGVNRRLSYRLNQITHQAKFDLIGRMDADDLISPVRFEKQLAILDDCPAVDLVTTGVCSLSKEYRPIGVRCGSPHDPITGRKLLLGQCAIVHAAIVGRKSWFLRNPYNTAIPRAQDYELWLRAFSRNDFRCYVIGEPLYYYLEEDNVTLERMMEALSVHRLMYKKYGYLGFKGPEKEIMKARLYGKSLIIRVLAALNRLTVLLERRNRIIDDPMQLAIYETEIRQILSTRVPGLDG